MNIFDKILNTPPYLQYHEWDVWHKEKKAEMPIRYFLCHTCPTFVWRLWDDLNNLKYWLKHHTVWFSYAVFFDKRFAKKYEYPACSYRDTDVIIEQIVFQEFMKFVQREYIEICEPAILQTESYWMMVNLHDEIDQILHDVTLTYKEPKMLFEKYLDKVWEGEIPEPDWRSFVSDTNKEYYGLMGQLDEFFTNKKTELLKRIIEIRGYLWD